MRISHETTQSRTIAELLSAALGGHWTLWPLGCSSFCATWRAESQSSRLFVKSVIGASSAVLAAEADGLAALEATGAIRVPAVVGYWEDPQSAVTALALEWLSFTTPDAGFGERFGHALACLHRAPPSEGQGRYGWRRDNMLGGTPQRNGWSTQGGLAGWIEFFARERLGAMSEHLRQKGGSPDLLQAVSMVIDTLPGFFADGYQPQASLIHGDLWSGNWGVLEDGTPVIYDPAVSCSDAEAELAMMELFGSPPATFRRAYGEVTPEAAGYTRRRALYQLYHLMNHALLFGGSYTRQSLSLAKALAR